MFESLLANKYNKIIDTQIIITLLQYKMKSFKLNNQFFSVASICIYVNLKLITIPKNFPFVFIIKLKKHFKWFKLLLNEIVFITFLHLP